MSRLIGTVLGESADRAIHVGTFFFFLIQVGTLIIASILALSGIRDSLGTVFDRATQLPESARLALLA